MVSVQLPAIEFGGESADAMTMMVVTEACLQRMPSIELTSETMGYVKIAMQRQRAKKRRTSTARVTISEPNVKMDYRRESAFVSYSDSDGRPRKHYMKPLSLAQHDVDQCARDLARFRDEHHVEPTSGESPPGNYAGA